MVDVFDKQKSSCLEGLDLSRKGSIDAPLLELANYINKHSDMFTLSSCSGRIVILRESLSSEKIRKAGCEWITVSHTELDPSVGFEAFRTRSKNSGCVVLKFEPFVLHVQCRSMAEAKQVHTAASESGFRNSGLSVGKAGKIVAAVRSTHGLEVPLTDDEGNDLVSKEYVEYVIKKSNAKLFENLERIKKFEEKLKEVMLTKTDKVIKPKEFYRNKKKKRFVDENMSVNEDDCDIMDSFNFPG
eukprot:TRINITY_DN29130_c0_g1_i1.p1 TRINITY_DN29130_c0_g1~~TRINITY_DN29130_c0_g1_i1.p1  ORF type:complete len:243 (-),score=60.16 TRINITY_DN29130_c0_g1_i1:32-760(-)